jgi:hypothetical protein
MRLHQLHLRTVVRILLRPLLTTQNVRSTLPTVLDPCVSLRRRQQFPIVVPLLQRLNLRSVLLRARLVALHLPIQPVPRPHPLRLWIRMIEKVREHKIEMDDSVRLFSRIFVGNHHLFSRPHATRLQQNEVDWILLPRLKD